MTHAISGKIQDPHNLVSGSVLEKMNQKISSAITRMFAKPVNGGNPFLFTYLASKPHILVADKELAEKIFEKEGRKVPVRMPFATAATNGKAFLWHPEFLEELDVTQNAVIMEHESYHVVLFHHKRLIGKFKPFDNIALDYIVNTIMHMERKNLNRDTNIWKGIGESVTLKTYLEWFDGTVAELPKRIAWVDEAVHGRSPESVYEDIMTAYLKSPRKCKCGALSLDPKTGKPKSKPCPDRTTCGHDGACCEICGALPDSGFGMNSMDGHIQIEQSDAEITGEVMKSASSSKMMGYGTPSIIEGIIGKLSNPVVDLSSMIRSSCMKKSKEDGDKNDWKRFNRRQVGQGIYKPKRFRHKSQWLCLFDTSGSMSDSDMKLGISQLQSIKDSTGYIVPVDSKVHWDHVSKINNKSELVNTKIVGRGGTVFNEFFELFPKKLGTEFDCIVVVTDGYFGDIPKNLRPPMDVIWVITTGENITPPFGRSVPLIVK
jgi:hypothetical protein